MNTIPMTEISTADPVIQHPKPRAVPKKTVNVQSIMSPIEVNNGLLSAAQVKGVMDIYMANVEAFDKDMSRG